MRTIDWSITGRSSYSKHSANLAHIFWYHSRVNHTDIYRVSDFVSTFIKEKDSGKYLIVSANLLLQQISKSSTTRKIPCVPSDAGAQTALLLRPPMWAALLTRGMQLRTSFNPNEAGGIIISKWSISNRCFHVPWARI